MCAVSSGGAMQSVTLQILWKVHFYSLSMMKQIPIQWRYVTLSSLTKCVQKVIKYIKNYLCSLSTIILLGHVCVVKSYHVFVYFCKDVFIWVDRMRTRSHLLISNTIVSSPLAPKFVLRYSLYLIDRVVSVYAHCICV